MKAKQVLTAAAAALRAVVSAALRSGFPVLLLLYRFSKTLAWLCRAVNAALVGVAPAESSRCCSVRF